MGQSGNRYGLEKKVEILDEIIGSGDSTAAIADKHGIPVGSLYNWTANEKAIRAAYAKELKQAERVNGKHSNGSNGHAKAEVKPGAESVEPPRLSVNGLEEVVRQQVSERMDADLPGLVDKALAKLLAERAKAN